MNSLKEKMSVLKKIQIESDEQFVVEVMHKGIKMADLVISIREIEYQASTGKSNVKADIINPNGYGEMEIVTTKYTV